MTLQLDLYDEQTAVALPQTLEELLRELMCYAGEAEGIASGDVAVTIVDDEEIRQLNLQYRGLDKPTDVLSFSMLESGDDESPIHYDEELPENMLGDIVISAPTAKRQSEEYGHSFERELGFLFVHGFLHLIGYDHGDAEAERIMTDKQEQALGRAGLSR